MADAVARSEARKRRILENAEKRINRLYSRQRAEHEINGGEGNDSKEDKSTESQQWTCEQCGNINFGNRKACLLCRGKQISDETENSGKTENLIEVKEIQMKETLEKSDGENSKERPLLISSFDKGELHQRKSNTVKLQRAEILPEVTVPDEVPLQRSPSTQPKKRVSYSQNQLFEMYRILGCILMAFVSRMVLKSGQGLFYFETIFLPFTALQFGLYLFNNNFLKGVKMHQSQNVMSAALMLCGLSPHLIQTYSRIMGYVKAVSEDFFFFLFVFFTCGLFI
ncbi:guided entry of tail-anchored proteins factor CAMLG [Magallana gigas]|uniref:guided entry of tail-anchored proteins factor CAMLG n=1 Tax=Magallana gigas TaxID=29159 RepID=UPI00333FBCC1